MVGAIGEMRFLSEKMLASGVAKTHLCHVLIKAGIRLKCFSCRAQITEEMSCFCLSHRLTLEFISIFERGTDVRTFRLDYDDWMWE